MLNPVVNIIDDALKFREFMSYVEERKPEFTFIDVETDSPQEKVAKLYGIGICFDTTEAFYIPWRDNKGNELWEWKDKQFITWFLSQLVKDTKVVNHNIIFDALVLEYNLGLDITPYIYSDTILLYHTLKEEGCDAQKPFGLKEICVAEFGEWAGKAKEALHDNIKANGGKVLKDQLEMFKADTAILGEYCGWDVVLTCHLFNKLEPELRLQGLDKLFYEDEIMPLYKEVTIPMKRQGFKIDLDYFKNLKVEVEQEINKLEQEIMQIAEIHIEDFCDKLLHKDYPVSNKGNFPKYLAEVIGAPLPVTKDGKVTLAAKHVQKQKEATPEFEEFYSWLQEDLTQDAMVTGDVVLQKGGRKEKIKYKYLTIDNINKAQKLWYFTKNPDEKYIFNLGSNDHLAHLIDALGYNPSEKTATGKPKIDVDFLDSIKGEEVVIQKLVDYKKLQKLLSTYIEGLLDRQIDGTIYASMLQFGTTSGRFSSRNPNLQNLPRVKEDDSGLSELVLQYVNAIKKGFIAPEGYLILNADYSQLEPSCFAHMSNEPKLRDVFFKGEDLYCRVAIDVNKLENEYSASKKAPNYLKNHKPELRQLWKVPVLGIPYGMEESRLREAIGCNYAEAAKIIYSYLNTYPNLKRYMNQCNYEAKHYGQVKTEFGRVRHLNVCKTLYTLYGEDILDYKWAKSRGLEDKRREFKNLINNAKNFKIQGLAAHIVNRAMLALTRAFKAANIIAIIIGQVHDEITCIVKKEQAEQAAKIMKEVLENTTKISVPLVAEPIIADNWADAK